MTNNSSQPPLAKDAVVVRPQARTETSTASPASEAPTAPEPATETHMHKPNKALGWIIGLVAVLGLGGIAAYYAYRSAHYVSTDNARVAANTAVVTPEIPGRILEWKVAVGTPVTAGQVIGQIDTSTVAQSSAVNSGALTQTAPLTASRSLVRAPISGHVIQTSALVGQLVGQTQSLAVIADDNSAYVSANIKEGEISKIKPGQVAHVKLDALPGQSLTGHVQQIGEATASTFSILPSGGADSGNFTKVEQVIPVSIYLTDVDRRKLLPGASADVTVDVADPAAKPVAVTLSKVSSQALNVQLNVVGTLSSGNDVNVTTQIPGTVVSLPVQVGDSVKKSQVVARIDDSSLRQQLAQAQAGLTQAENTVQSARAALSMASSTLDRIQSVYALGGASAQDLQNAQTQYTAAQVNYRNANGAAIEAARAAVNNLKVNLNKTVITSPINGIVSARNVQQGEVASPGVPIVSIVQGSPRKIVATISSAQANLVKPGDTMSVHFDAQAGKTYAAKVTTVNPTSVATGNFYPLEARLDNEHPELRAGMIANGTVSTQLPASTLVIPSSAVTRIGAQNYVYVAQGDKVNRTPVQLSTLGQQAGKDVVAVTSGLNAGDSIVSSGVDALWDGAPITQK